VHEINADGGGVGQKLGYEVEGGKRRGDCKRRASKNLRANKRDPGRAAG
jgi:hypothetical protein